MYRRLRSIQLNSNQLKVIAIVAMVIDHIASILLPHDFPIYWLMRMIGRLTAPIMCYFIAEGYYHTSNLKKYTSRLFLVAVISHFPHNLCYGQSVFKFWEATDVMFSLMFGLIALAAYKSKQFSPLQKLLIIAACCLLSYSADWNYIAVLWILGFGIFHGKPSKQIAAFIAVSCLYLFQGVIYHTAFPFISRMGVFLAIPLFLLYNGQRGKKSKLIKWGFYWFYPVHLLIFYLISQWM